MVCRETSSSLAGSYRLILQCTCRFLWFALYKRATGSTIDGEKLLSQKREAVLLRWGELLTLSREGSLCEDRGWIVCTVELPSEPTVLQVNLHLVLVLLAFDQVFKCRLHLASTIITTLEQRPNDILRVDAHAKVLSLLLLLVLLTVIYLRVPEMRRVFASIVRKPTILPCIFLWVELGVWIVYLIGGRAKVKW